MLQDSDTGVIFNPNLDPSDRTNQLKDAILYSLSNISNPHPKTISTEDLIETEALYIEALAWLTSHGHEYDVRIFTEGDVVIKQIFIDSEKILEGT